MCTKVKYVLLKVYNHCQLLNKWMKSWSYSNVPVILPPPGSRTHLPAVSQRPDILPLKGIMKTPGSSHKGSPHTSGSSHSSLVKIPADVTSQDKLGIIHPASHPAQGQADNDSECVSITDL